MLEFDQKIIFGNEYRSNRQDEFTIDFITSVENKLEPVRNELEESINQLISNCRLKYNLQQIQLKNKGIEKEVIFFIDLDLIKV
jgi:hypothetical protein